MPDTFGTVLLLRHGATDDDLRPEKHNGIEPVPINALGEAQARAAGRRLKGLPIRSIFTSDVLRARQTAEIVCDVVGIPLQDFDDDLRPWDIGDYAGTLVSKTGPILWNLINTDPNTPVPGGDSWNTFLNYFYTALQGYHLESERAPGILILCVHSWNFIAAEHLASRQPPHTIAPPRPVKPIWTRDQAATWLPPNGGMLELDFHDATAKPFGISSYVSERREITKADPTAAAILAIADRLAPAFRRAFLDAVAAADGAFTTGDIVQLLEAGDVRALEHTGVWQAFQESLGPDLRRAVQQAVLAAGGAAVETLPSSVATQLSFTLGNPYAVEAIDTAVAASLNTITNVSADGITSVLRQGFTDGVSPAAMARRIRALLGLTDRDALAVETYRNSLIEAGTAIGRATELADAYAARLLRQRADTIALTETIRAANAGQEAAWRDAQAQGLLGDDQREFWIVTPDDRLCPICEGIPPLNPDGVPIGQPFESALGPVRWMAHPRCRCTQVLKTPQLQETA